MRREELTLDPPDWDALRSLGRRMVDDSLTWLETVRERPVWRPMPEEVRRRFEEPLPREPGGAEAAYRDFRELVLPYPHGNVHPRFWGWVTGTGTPTAALADFLASVFNPNQGGFEHAGIHVERQVLAWLREALGFPSGASGLLTSGGSVANLIGLTVARNAGAGFDVRERGLAGGPRLAVYGSSETHSSVRKALETLGLGNQALRTVPTDASYRVDVGELRSALERDRAAGWRPVAVVGNAGTTSTGAIDDLEALADLCEEQSLWFHVDGAFGAFAALDPELRPRVDGLERADSLVCDLHKWMVMPFEVGCVLVRDPERHRAAFCNDAAYLPSLDRGPTAGGTHLADLGLQLSRGFRALKVWISLREHGIERFARLVRQNVEQARYLAQKVDEHPRLERMAPVALNVVCFRYALPDAPGPCVDELNERLLGRLQASGLAIPSHARLRGRYALRVAITNHRSRREDFDLLVETVARLGDGMTAGLPPRRPAQTEEPCR